jgi:hypothetical protein
MSKNAPKRLKYEIGGAIQVLAREIRGKARDILTDRKRSDTVVIHDYRRTMKRWRALLRLLEPILGLRAKAARKAARDLARDVSGTRDLQSTLDVWRSRLLLLIAKRHAEHVTAA